MDAQQFLDEFGHIANAPGGIAKLRGLILGMAVQGRLVAQEKSDVPAIVLLTRIRREKDLFIMAKKKRRAAPYGPVTDMEKKISLPLAWEWARLGEIAFKLTDGSHNPPKGSVSGYPMLSGQNVIDGTIDFSNPSRFLSEDDFIRENSRTEVRAGDVMLTIVGTIGRSAVVPATAPPFVLQRSVAVIRTPLLSEFLSMQLRSPVARSYYDTYAKGTAQKGIYLAKLGEMPVAVPPLAEQSRIVAKVHELMALCDTLEVQQQARRKLQNNLRQSTLQAVARAASPQELQTAWTLFSDNFWRLFHAREDVDDLRKAVLDLAISGYLSNPEKSDTPASALKAEILAAKDRGVADGSFSRKKHVKPEGLEETTLPAHWESITLDDAISTIDAGWSPACLHGPREDENKWGVLKTTSIQVLLFLPHEHKELPASLDPRPQYQIELGDILITRAGPKNRVGICCVVDYAPPKLMISDKIIRFHIVEDLINPLFVSICLSAGEPGRIVERLKSGMADSQMNISQDKLRSITIPLPPIEEQHRILKKIEAFMRLADIYCERFRKRERLARQLADTAVAAITGIAIEQKEEPMKAPQTELIAPLRLGTAPKVNVQAPLATILVRHNGEMASKDLWQRFGGEIDAFYAQLKTEVAHGWILEPGVAEMREKTTEDVGA